MEINYFNILLGGNIMKNRYLEWLNMEIEKTNKELQSSCNSLKSDDVKLFIVNSNTVELIRAAEVKLKTLEIVKQMYQANHKLI